MFYVESIIQHHLVYRIWRLVFDVVSLGLRSAIFLSGVAACHFVSLMHDSTVKVLGGAPTSVADPLISGVCAMGLTSSAHLSNVRQHQAGMLSGLHSKDRKLWGDLQFLYYFCPCIVPLRHV
jgi:hypothetical protein